MSLPVVMVYVRSELNRAWRLLMSASHKEQWQWREGTHSTPNAATELITSNCVLCEEDNDVRQLTDGLLIAEVRYGAREGRKHLQRGIMAKGETKEEVMLYDTWVSIVCLVIRAELSKNYDLPTIDLTGRVKIKKRSLMSWQNSIYFIVIGYWILQKI